MNISTRYSPLEFMCLLVAKIDV